MKWAIFERVYTIVRIASYPSTLGSRVMKSIETESQGLVGTGKRHRRSVRFLGTRFDSLALRACFDERFNFLPQISPIKRA
jgi:hypothetical protein